MFKTESTSTTNIFVVCGRRRKGNLERRERERLWNKIDYIISDSHFTIIGSFPSLIFSL